MNDFIKKAFSLDGLVVYGASVKKDEIVIKAGKLSNGSRCPHCNTYTKRVHEKRKYRKFRHTVLGNRPVSVLLGRRRFKCINNSCGKSFIEPVDFLGIKPWKRRTFEFDKFVLRALKDQSFKSIEGKYGISYSTARKALEDLVDPQDILWEEKISNSGKGIKKGVGEEKRSVKPLKLGIDEHHFKNRKMLITISDLSERKVLAVLKDARKTSLERFLKSIPQERKKRINEACIDMHLGYRNAIRKCLPNVSIVIDHFHVIQHANRQIDEERRSLQIILRENGNRNSKIRRYPLVKNIEDLSNKELDYLLICLKKHPTLALLHFTKESLRKMYRCEKREDARKILFSLISILRGSDDPFMYKYGGTLRRYSREILNYFDNRTTNAYCEGVNNKFKVTQRISFGFRNVDVYVRKAVLSFIPLSMLGILPNFAH